MTNTIIRSLLLLSYVSLRIADWATIKVQKLVYRSTRIDFS